MVSCRPARTLHKLDKQPLHKELEAFPAASLDENECLTQWRHQCSTVSAAGSTHLCVLTLPRAPIDGPGSHATVAEAADVLCSSFNEGSWKLIRAGCTGGLENREHGEAEVYATCRCARDAVMQELHRRRGVCDVDHDFPSTWFFPWHATLHTCHDGTRG